MKIIYYKLYNNLYQRDVIKTIDVSPLMILLGDHPPQNSLPVLVSKF